jgi:hypothetical protein
VVINSRTQPVACHVYIGFRSRSTQHVAHNPPCVEGSTSKDGQDLFHVAHRAFGSPNDADVVVFRAAKV